MGLSIGIDTLLVSYGGQTDKTEVTVTEPADVAIDPITAIIPSTRSLAKGVYILVLQSGNKVVAKKIISN